MIDIPYYWYIPNDCPADGGWPAFRALSRHHCVTLLIEAVEKIVGRSLKLFGVSPVLVGLLFVCGQSFADSAQQRREGAQFCLGQYYLGCLARSPSAASVLLGPGGTTSILRRCDSHKGTTARNNRGPSTPDHLPVPARGRIVVCRKGIDLVPRHGGKIP